MEPGRAREVAAEALRAYADLEFKSSEDRFLVLLAPVPGRAGAPRGVGMGSEAGPVLRVRSQPPFQTRKTVRSVDLVPMTGFLGCLDEAELQELMEAIRDAEGPSGMISRALGRGWTSCPS